MNEIEDLGAEVEATEGADASAGVLIDGFVAYVAAHLNDPAALRGYIDRLKASRDTLTAKVVANPAPV